MKFSPHYILTLSLILGSLTASANDELRAKLKSFDADSAKFMDQIPEKKGRNTKSLFSAREIQSKKYIEAKNANRKLRGRSAIEGNDHPEDLVDLGSHLVDSLSKMDQDGLTKAKLSVQPWSDHYWALYSGQTAMRYADSNFPNVEDWKKNADFVLGNEPSSVNDLSPSEKYDLIVGDANKTLTKKALAEGEEYFRSSGSVETWMGICHGWAPAAYMIDRPNSSVKVLAADGSTKVTFYPSDIKALASLVWAKNSGETKFIGGRCNVKNPKKNRAGRITDQDCFDTNPGAWHMAIVNQVGKSNRSLVIDATFDYEVWNQPVQGYTYSYFNPQTLEPVNSLNEAKVARGDFSKDKFKKFRSEEASHMVGINMELSYVVETNPSTKASDSESDDAITTVSYQYDLELDSQGKIIGGEWYNNTHPDFLWTAVPKARAKTPGDDMIRSSWDPSDAMPDDWQKVAKRTSQSGSPLLKIVEALVNKSHRD